MMYLKKMSIRLNKQAHIQMSSCCGFACHETIPIQLKKRWKYKFVINGTK